MKTVLFYFTATGNSLSTARLLARDLGDCRLIGLAALKDRKNIPVQAEAVGFVFPIYYSDMPHLMRRVIPNLCFEGTPYIFSVCTCRGHYGDIALRLNELLGGLGQKLSCNFAVSMPGNSRLSTPEENDAMLALQETKVAEIAQELKTFPVKDYSFQTPLERTPVHDASNMRGMAAEEHCVGCGLCEQICPMGNIRLVSGKPLFGENCCSCLACFHWCPREAVWMSKAPEDMMRRFKYHHPDVTLADIRNQKE